jgi:hypothetical protein
MVVWEFWLKLVLGRGLDISSKLDFWARGIWAVGRMEL